MPWSKNPLFASCPRRETLRSKFRSEGSLLSVLPVRKNRDLLLVGK